MKQQKTASITLARTRQAILLASGLVLLAVGHYTEMPLGGVIELGAAVVFGLAVWWSDGLGTGVQP